MTTAVPQGLLKDPTTIKNLYEEARRNADKNISSDPIVRQGLSDIRQLVGGPFETGVLKKPNRAVQASSALRKSVIRFKDANPTASEGQIANFVHEETVRIVKIFKPDTELADYDIDTMSRQQSSQPAPQSAYRARPEPPEDSQTVSVQQPVSDFDWKRKPAFSDPQALESAYEAFREGDLTGNFARWVSALGITSAEQLAEFISAQRALLQ